MHFIQQIGPRHETVQDAKDNLEGIARLPSFGCGYVDEKEQRVIAFFYDHHPDHPLGAGQRRLELLFALEKHQTPDDLSGLAPIADAIRDGKDLTAPRS